MPEEVAEGGKVRVTGTRHTHTPPPQHSMEDKGIGIAACRVCLTALSVCCVLCVGVGPRERRARFDLPAVVLLHGFDSSCLEYRWAYTTPTYIERETCGMTFVLCVLLYVGRRLHPLLDEEVDVFALDVLGWGFSQVTTPHHSTHTGQGLMMFHVVLWWAG